MSQFQKLERLQPGGHRKQKGMATLMVALVILVILTVIVLGSTGVALFEQRTATNENRQRLADQAARYSLNLAGEFFKANIVNVASSQFGGWLATNTMRWARCSTVMDATTKIAPNLADGSPHPCMGEPDAVRRAELYFYSFNHGLSDNLLVPFDSLVPNAGKLTTVGGAAAFPSSAKVRALLCRIDTTLTEIDFGPDGVLGGGDDTTVMAPGCRAEPDSRSNNRIALTFITRAQLDNESAVAEAKETWASFNSVSANSTVPLVASGGVNMQGNVEIVASPNGAGFGLPVSMWSAENIDVDKNPNLPGGGSAASISSCQLGDFLNMPYRLNSNNSPTPLSELKTTCPNVNNACGCPAANSGAVDFLSGKTPPASNYCCENVDILDVDCGNGSPNPSPDIQFFPGMGHVYTGSPSSCVKGAAAAYDHAYDASKTAEYNASALSDDSLFEWVFDVNFESVSMNAGGNGQTLSNCGDAANENCAIYALTAADQLNAQQVTCAEFQAIGAEAVGLYYITDSPTFANGCQLPNQVGSPEAQAIVVMDDKAKINQTLLYGMLVVRSDTKTADLHVTGKAYVIGSIVVEGVTTGNGGATIVHDPAQASAPGDKFPEQTRLARLPGSWLDGRAGGF